MIWKLWQQLWNSRLKNEMKTRNQKDADKENKRDQNGLRPAIIISLYQQIFDSCVKFVSNFQLNFVR